MGASSAVVVSTADVDQARAAVGDVFCPHRLEPADGARLRLRLRVRTMGEVGLVHLDYGAPVLIEPGALDHFYLVQRPLRGQARIQQGGEQMVSSPRVASVLSPGLPVSMTWGPDNPQSIVYLSRTAVERELGRLLGRPVTRPVVFDLRMSECLPAVEAWLRAVAYVDQEIERDNPLFADPRHRSAAESMLVGQLLSAQPHSYTTELCGAGRAAAGKVVRRAMELIAEHHAEPLTVADVAEAVGVSVRSLQEGFRRETGSSPISYLQEHRLAAVRAALISADPARTTVTAVAVTHGFPHLGRFAVSYRKAYGEAPSETLRR